MFAIAQKLGGMTVTELEERLTVTELAEWGALFEVEAEEHKKAMREAEQKSKARSRRR
ncbi:MAG: hypothetical protein JNJ54_35020 [Myxococcaceae bacterium]|nr:hypothetical protein [Myxococcaceae bacterium]